MATCPMCNADVEDMDQHQGEAHGDGDSNEGGDMGGNEGGDQPEM